MEGTPMSNESTGDTDCFREGDRVRHKGEGVKGEVVSTAFKPPKFKVEWDDGYETLESVHTVEMVNNRCVDTDTDQEAQQ